MLIEKREGEQKMNSSIKYTVLFFWLLIVLMMLGCKSLNDAPISTLYVIDIQNRVCSKRIITNKNTLASQWVEDMPIEKCDGIVGLSAKEFMNLRTYMKGN